MSGKVICGIMVDRPLYWADSSENRGKQSLIIKELGSAELGDMDMFKIGKEATEGGQIREKLRLARKDVPL